jgi:hypothetical protein
LVVRGKEITSFRPDWAKLTSKKKKRGGRPGGITQVIEHLSQMHEDVGSIPIKRKERKERRKEGRERGREGGGRKEEGRKEEGRKGGRKEEGREEGREGGRKGGRREEEGIFLLEL